MKSQAKNKKKKIFVGMSGGVDSSVTAALLNKKRNYDVYGVFIRGWYPSGIPCTWRQDRRDAMRVAALLDIPFYTFDLSREYKKHIIDYMIKEYAAGRTPNPDIMCNKYIKFDSFLNKALEIGADHIATGHYIKIQNLKRKAKNYNSKLKIAKDINKDQSYFLWTLTQKQLKYCLFPLGDYSKPEVREMAKKFKLPVANKRDSQGLCFVGEFKMEDFLKEHIKPKPGKILDHEGKIIGDHNGVQYYTVGQRHGIGRTCLPAGKAGVEPLYIVEKNLKKNTLTVAPKSKERKYYKSEIKIKDINWLSGELPDTEKTYQARIRYRQTLQNCKIEKIKTDIKIIFEEPQKAVAAGQSLVLYDNEEMLGGGIIA